MHGNPTRGTLTRTAKRHHMMIPDRKGMSLIELMVVIAIIGILLSVAIPPWTRYTQNADLKTAARGIAGDFFNMKQRAVGETANYRITFDEGNNSYQMSNADTGDVVQSRNISEFGAGVTLNNANFGGGASKQIDFYARGTSKWGSVILNNIRGSTATITVNSAGRTYVSVTLQ
jgi:prepilin-type N-terminal cleavage/methylation domain-containing protein